MYSLQIDASMLDRAALLFLAAIPLLVYAAHQAVYYRRFKQYEAWPQLKPSLFWGHLKVMQEFISKGDPKRDIDMVLSSIFRTLGKPPVMIFDLRPISYPMVVVTSHEVAEQVSKPTKAFPWSLPKSPTINAIESLIGQKSILTLAGEEWKNLRRRYNPGFSPQHLMGLLPCILDKTQFFLKHLDDYCASGEEFRLDIILINLTFDIIGAVTMDVNFGAQESKERKGELISLYTELLDTFSSGGSMISIWSRLKRLKRRSLAKRIDKILKTNIHNKFAELKQREADAASTTTIGKDKLAASQGRNITSLSLQGLDKLNERIVQDTCDQLKTFLLAGHDTTSILLQWCFYELTRSPGVKARLYTELDDIFGPDPDPASVRAQLLERGEELVKRMMYTSAVVKELLRLHAPVGTVRRPPPGSGFIVRLPDGKELCLDGVVVYNCANIIQRDEAVYGDTADLFIPERWLGNSDTSMATNEDDGTTGSGKKTVPPSAWRPFERGPRSCIGQELANIEARVILACCVRRYDFIKVGLGELDLDEKGQPVMNDSGQYKVKTEMYSTRQVTAKPIDGTRMLVQLSARAKAAAA